jgi:hypothetical protein
MGLSGFSKKKSKFVETSFMSASSLDIELSKYWVLLSPEQKKSLIEFIKSFVQPVEKTGQELQEPEADYGIPDSVFMNLLGQLSYEQKSAVIELLLSFNIEVPGQRISIEQYNKEIDEAMKEIDAGEFYTHEEVIEMAKKWVKNGK